MKIDIGKKSQAFTVLGLYLVFLLIGIFGGTTTLTVDLVSPKEMERVRPPVELTVRVTSRGLPVPNATVRFSVSSLASYQETDAFGTARFLFVPRASANYTWSVIASKEGYPTVLSETHSFSIRLSLSVEPFSPSPYDVKDSPVDFKVRVRDVNMQPVSHANATLYVDGRAIGSDLTDARGLAALRRPVEGGRHMWFASAYKNSESGISSQVTFIVSQEGQVVDSKLWHSKLQRSPIERETAQLSLRLTLDISKRAWNDRLKIMSAAVSSCRNQ